MDHVNALAHIAAIQNVQPHNYDEEGEHLNFGPSHIRMRQHPNPFLENTDSQFLKWYRYSKEGVRWLTLHLLGKIANTNLVVAEVVHVSIRLKLGYEWKKVFAGMLE